MALFRRRKPAPQAPRQRTLTGGRPQAFSYHANRTEQDYNVGRAQPREQDVRRRETLVRFWKQRLSVLLMGLLVIVCLGYILHLSPTPKVVPLTSSSNDYFLQPSSVYTTAATKLLQGSFLNGNKITIDTDGLKQKLQQQFPELSDVSITLPLMGHHPYVYISPTDPSLVLAGKNGSYLLDTSGKALLPISKVSDLNKLNLPTVTDQSNLSVKPNSEALPATSVTFIAYVLQELQAKGMSASNLSLPATTAYELDVTPKGEGYFVKFNLHDYQHAREQVGTFLAVQKRLDSQSITPSSYIDVRLVGRAYYK